MEETHETDKNTAEAPADQNGETQLEEIKEEREELEQERKLRAVKEKIGKSYYFQCNYSYSFGYISLYFVDSILYPLKYDFQWF